MKNTMIKVWGIALTVAILAGLLMAFSAAPVSAGSSPATTQIATPTAQLTTANIDFMAAAADGKTVFVYSLLTVTKDASSNVVGNPGALYKSVDGGMTWARTSATYTQNNGLDGQTLTGLVVSSNFATDNVVVATTAGNVFVSTNAGVSFFTPTQYTTIGTGTIQSVAVTSVGGAYTILVGTTTDMYVYSQNTGTWTAQSTLSLPAGSVLAVAFSPNYVSDQEILSVTLSGLVARLNFKISTANWNFLGSTAFSAPTLAVTGTITKAVMAFGSDYYPYGGGTVLIGVSGQGATSTTGTGDDLYSATLSSVASVWSDKDVGGAATNTSVNSIAVNGTLTAGKIYVGKSTGAVSKVTGLGNAWVAATKGPSGTNALVAIVGANVVAGTNGAGGAFYTSTDDAVTFNAVSMINVSSTANLKVMNFSAVDANTIFLMMVDGGNDLVFKTADGGTTWMEIMFGTGLFGVFQSPSYATDNTVYIPSNNPIQVWASANGGSSFAPQFVPGPSSSITAFLPVDGTTYYLGYATGVSKSGRFSPLVSTTTTGTIYSIARGPAGEIFVGTSNNSVYMSTDDAVTFTAVGGAGAVGTGNVSVALDNSYATNKKIYAVTSGAGGGYTFTVGTSLTWAPLGLSPFASPNFEVDAGGEFYYSNLSANATLGRTLSTIVNDPIDPAVSTTAGVASAPWLVGAEFDWVNVIPSTAGNVIIALAGNSFAPTNAGLYSPSYKYTFRLVKIVDNFVTAPAVTSPAANAQTTTNPTFTWSPVAGATSYDLAFGPDSTVLYPTISATSPAAAYTVPATAALSAGATYNLRVRVTLASPLVSYWSAPVTFVVKLTQNPNTAPTPAAPAPGAVIAATTPTFQWAASGLAATYDFKLSSKPDFSDTIDSTTGLTGNLYTTNVTLKPGAYYWEVRAVSGTVVGDWIQSSFSVGAAPTATGGGTNTVTIPPITIPAITVPTPVVNIPTSNVTVVNPTPTFNLTQSAATTPAWVWVMIVIGAVLVIAVIVLIVRTRKM